MSVTIRQASLDDLSGILATHKAAAVKPGRLARTPEEITEAYVRGVIETPGGVCLVAVDQEGGASAARSTRAASISRFSPTFWAG